MIAAERGAAKNTLEAYRRDIADYLGFLSDAGDHPLLAGTERVRTYLAHLHGKGLKPSSSARRLSALRQFHKFLFAEGHRSDDPTVVLEGPRRGRPLPKIMSVEDVDRLLAVASEGLEDATRPAGERTRAARLYCLLELLYATGMRVSELVSLPASAARAASGRVDVLTIRGKGGRERLVPLSEPAKKAIGCYRAAVTDGSRGKTAAQGRLAVPGRQRNRPPHAPSLRPRSQMDGGGGRPERQHRSVRMCCGTPSPATCCRTAPICASSRSFSATPISRRRRSIPTCSTSA